MKVLLLLYEIYIIFNISRWPKIGIKVIIATSCTKSSCIKFNMVIFPHKIVIF